MTTQTMKTNQQEKENTEGYKYIGTLIRETIKETQDSRGTIKDTGKDTNRENCHIVKVTVEEDFLQMVLSSTNLRVESPKC